MAQSSPQLLLPHSIEAETALLGALAIDPAQFLDVGYLVPSDFYLVNNSFLYEAMQTLFVRHGGYDWLTVTEHLRSAGRLDDIGGEVAIADLMNATPTSYGAPEYAAIVYRHSVSRQVIKAATDTTQAAYQDVAARVPSDLVNEAIERLSRIEASRNISNGPQLIKVGVTRLLDRMEEIEANGCLAGLPTGIKTLDHIIGGLRKNKLHLLAGRPGMGKSGLALQIAANVARTGVPVLFFALEMPDDDISGRLIASLCGIDYETYNRPGVRHWKRVLDASEQVSRLPLLIDCASNHTVSSIRSVTRKLMLEYPIGLVVIDHGGLVRPAKFTGDPYKDQTQVAGEMIGLSKQLDGVPVLCLLQLSRAVEGRADKRPKMHDLRSTGDWEQNADAIMFMYRDEVYNDDTQTPGLGEICIEKNRGGKSGVNIQIAANVALNRFVDLEVRTEPL
jgi:replicative DNA helicase